MINALELENFKAFGDRVRVEMAPITLLYGQNSAGKSSILHALGLLKQTHRHRDLGAPFIAHTQSGVVNLGSFREMVFDHDPSRDLRIRIDMPAETQAKRLIGAAQSMPQTQMPLGVELRLGERPGSREVGLKSMSITVDGRGQPYAEFASTWLPTSLNLADGLVHDWTKSAAHHLGVVEPSDWGLRLVALSRSELAWREAYDIALAHREVIHNLLVESWTKHCEWMAYRYPEIPLEDEAAAHEAAVRFYSSPFSIRQFMDRISGGWRDFAFPLEGLLPARLEPMSDSALHELNALRIPWRDGQVCDEYGRRIPNFRGSLALLELRGVINEVTEAVSSTLDSLFPLGPLRRPAERSYLFTGSAEPDVGHHGERLPHILFLRPDLVERTNQWLDRLKLGYQINVRRYGDAVSDLFSLRVIDTSRGSRPEVDLSDVGFGVSQILPLLVQCAVMNRQIIAVEQPEVHVHPRLQADLGDVLIECIGKPHSHQFVIETHSEHLILRLQRRIREGTLSADDVSVIFVERGESGSRVRRLHLDKDGEFTDEWPGGFFVERLRDLA